MPESEIRQILTKSRKHNDLIRSIQFISCTDKPLILTGSTDRLVHLIDLETSAIVGTLKQGYKSMMNYQWDFPCTTHAANLPHRETRMEKILKEVRIKRDEDLSTKKFKEIQLLKEGKLNTFGFAGAQLMGMSAQSGNVN